jgi:hypothetical protein
MKTLLRLLLGLALLLVVVITGAYIDGAHFPEDHTATVTENGFIHPPVYRFMMRHVMGMTDNLNIYLKDIQAAFPA